MGRFFGWKLRKHICIPNFYSGQYHQTIFHDTYFSNCIFSFICWQKSSILRISSKKFLSSKVFEDFSKFRRIFIFVFGLFSKSEDSSSSVHFQSSLQHCTVLWQVLADIRPNVTRSLAKSNCRYGHIQFDIHIDKTFL